MSTTESQNKSDASKSGGDNKENESESCVPTKKSSGGNKAWKIGDFDVGKALGKGRFGHVYCARETKSGYVVGKSTFFSSEKVDFHFSAENYVQKSDQGRKSATSSAKGSRDPVSYQTQEHLPTLWVLSRRPTCLHNS